MYTLVIKYNCKMFEETSPPVIKFYNFAYLNCLLRKNYTIPLLINLNYPLYI